MLLRRQRLATEGLPEEDALEEPANREERAAGVGVMAAGGNARREGVIVEGPIVVDVASRRESSTEGRHGSDASRKEAIDELDREKEEGEETEGLDLVG